MSEQRDLSTLDRVKKVMSEAFEAELNSNRSESDLRELIVFIESVRRTGISLYWSVDNIERLSLMINDVANIRRFLKGAADRVVMTAYLEADFDYQAGTSMVLQLHKLRESGDNVTAPTISAREVIPTDDIEKIMMSNPEFTIFYLFFVLGVCQDMAAKLAEMLPGEK